MSDQVELLFFDTFAHDNTEEINLDLVQFPKPVYVTEVRIIPLGARVQADFPGGVRLGATNPSQFQIEFFVNDLGKPGASTFETLGGFEYDQNGCINLECTPDESVRKIPTDGLVLKGWYTTITLAVYGTLTNNITEQIIQPVVNPSLPAQPNTIADAQQIISGTAIEPEWQEPIPTVPCEYNSQQNAGYHQTYNQPEPYAQEFSEYYPDVPKDPRGYHHTPETEWDNKGRSRLSDTDRERDRDRERNREMTYQKSSSDRDHGREREKRYSRSESRDRDRQTREYRDLDRDREHNLEWVDHDRHEHDWSERDRDRGHDRDRDRRHDEYRRSYNRSDDREDRKRPRTPPIQSPKRPRTPLKDKSPIDVETTKEDEEKPKREEKTKSPQRDIKEVRTPPTEESTQMDVEEFEPILSDEDILDDAEHYQDMDYDYSMYTNNDDIIKLFTPGVTKLKKYPKGKTFVIKNNTIEIEETFKTTVGITDDYFKSSITKYNPQTFDKLNTEIKEEFIHLCERLMATIGPPEVFSYISKLCVDTKSMNIQNLNVEDKELVEQVHFVVESFMDWLKIAMSYDLANMQDQPAYRIRHIKCGVRLADYCSYSVDFLTLLWHDNFSMHKELLNLYDKEYMALSIKLMILKALDTYLRHKFSIEKFLLGNTTGLPKENGYCDTLPVSETNGYRILVQYLRKTTLVRIKFALASILKKLNLYEVLHKMHSILIKLRNVTHDISTEEINLITKSLNEVLHFCRCDPFTFSQPKRFLPVSAQFEILRSNTNNVLVEYFKMFNLLQCFVLLLTYPSTLNLPLIKTPIFEIVSSLLDISEGLQYLSENSKTIDILLKCLLRTDEEVQYNIQEGLEIKSHHLGLTIGYKLQSLYHIEYLLDIGKKCNLDYDIPEIIDQLHGLFCLTFSSIGKHCCAEMLGINDNIKCLLQFVEPIVLKEKSETQLFKIKKSPGIAYVVDLLAIAFMVAPDIVCIEKHCKVLFQLIIQQDIFEETVVNRLNELRMYLMPFENVSSVTFDNISPFLDIIVKYTENFILNMGPIITSLRVIQYLGISKHSHAVKSLSENPLCDYVELKYKYVILQVHSLDGMTILSKLLQRICDHYEQPSVHSSIFVSNQGLQLLYIIDPSITLLKQMLANVIQCQNINYKDLTTIPVLLQTYNLLNTYPNTAAGYHLSQQIKAKIIEVLLVYTQPVSEEVNEKESLNKTLWTQMCGELIKYTTSSPYMFIPGLLIFSELLPLPLPVQTQDDLSKEEISWVINLRKLWSAHLHPHSTVIQEMVNKLCISTQPQLLNLLRRICVQISDLAANSAIMIARGILDNVYDVLIPKEDTKMGPCSSHLARLLNFLACLVTHNTIKCAVLHLIHTNSTVTLKTDEKYVSLISAFTLILKNNSTTNSHIQAQECILSIIQSFCDVEITLMQNSLNDLSELPSEVYLANALPIKEHLLVFIQIMLEHLTTENSFVTYLPIVRTLLLLTEHDYGFYHLRENLLKRTGLFSVLLNKLADNFSKTNAECLSTLNTLVEFLRVSISIDEEAEANLLYMPRRIKLTPTEMKSLIGWPQMDDTKHPLVTLENTLKEVVQENNTFESFLEGLSMLLKLLEEDQKDESKDIYTEIPLPIPETLLVQFNCRTVSSSADACDERLTSRYWLAAPTEDGETDMENVTCDLIELSRQSLRQDFNLIREVEKLCRISRTDNPDDKEKQIDDQKLKKKPLIAPTRAKNFPRTIQQRQDPFRSRPPNTSRPPSLHVDDFVALETCGAQPTGPTGYNKISREFLASTRVARGTRGRAFVTSERSVQYRQMPWWGAGLGRVPYQM